MTQPTTVKVSVIVLIYNVEQYIEQSASSLLEQTLDKIEFIFVNDRTPDDSMMILDRVLNRYPELRKSAKIITHDANKGSATARNTGLDAATGEYVIFADSDDWLETDMLERLYAKAKQGDYDIVWCDFYKEKPRKRKYMPQKFREDPVFCVKSLLSNQMYGAVWNKLVRRDLYTKHGLRFFDGLDMWEDLAMSIRLFTYTDRICHIPQALYHYRYNPGSIVNSEDRVKTEKRLSNMFMNVSKIEEFLRSIHLEERYKVEVNYLKLHAKSRLVRPDPKRWHDTFPESNPFVFSCPSFPLKFRMIQWFYARRVFVISRFVRK